MSSPPQPRTQKLTIIAQDPSVKVLRTNPETNEEEEVILTTQVEIPAEGLAPGPRGYRIQIIDYDSSTGILYPPLEYRILEQGRYNDPFVDEPDKTLLNDPRFHAQNVYAIIMRILARFEFALGRRVGWGFDGHQILVAPHAFADANAFYSEADRALLFGYFPKSSSVSSNGSNGVTPEMAYSCLSHDIVAHETTHALLDGLRTRFTDPSSPDQAGFHEGFADVVALLSFFSMARVVEMIIDKKFQEDQGPAKGKKSDSRFIDVKSLESEKLKDSLLLGLAEEFGQEMSGGRNSALRRSVKLSPDPNIRNHEQFKEPHALGEILVAAMMNAFVEVWLVRLKGLGNKQERDQKRKSGKDAPEGGQLLDRQRVVEEGANIADYLLTMSIRALDYTPPSDIEFSDFLSALLTADREIRPDDSKYKFRSTLLKSFAGYGLNPTSKGDGTEIGVWEPPDAELCYDRIHLESLLRDKDEMFRFIWENRSALGLEDDAYTRVLSVRPCVRVNPEDGFTLRETVSEYHQILELKAPELRDMGIKTPHGMPENQTVTLYGGGALILDEFGRVKFHIRNRLLNPIRQTLRLSYLWAYGAIQSEQELLSQYVSSEPRRFARMHEGRFGAIFPLETKFEGEPDDHYIEKIEQVKEEAEPEAEQSS